MCSLTQRHSLTHVCRAHLTLTQSIKCKAMDLVIFCRHGSFYNLFDVDADVGLRVGLQVSKLGCVRRRRLDVSA